MNAGSSVLGTRFSFQVPRYSMRDTGCGIRDSGYEMRDDIYLFSLRKGGRGMFFSDFGIGDTGYGNNNFIKKIKSWKYFWDNIGYTNSQSNMI